LSPNLKTNFYGGNVKIKLMLLKSTCFVLNLNKLTIKDIKLSHQSLQVYKHQKDGIFVVDFKLQVNPHVVYTLDVDFEGSIQSSFLVKNEDFFSVENTSFVFPCFNEPQFKSIYKIHVNTSNLLDNHVVLSNMPSYSFNNSLISFNETFEVSSNQIGIMILKNDSKEFKQVKLNNDVEFNFYGTSVNELTFIEESLNCTRFIETMLNFKLFIPKIDFVDSPFEYQKIGLISSTNDSVCKSISKMWNGGLISFLTPDEWIKDSLLEYTEYSRKLNQKYEFLLSDYLSTTLQMDSYLLTIPLKSRERKFHNYDSLKGFSILYTISNEMGHSTFKTLLQEFYHDYQFQNVTSEIFFSFISSFDSNFNYDSMTRYSRNPGIPLIILTKEEDTLIASQSKYSFNKNLNLKTDLWGISMNGFDDQRKKMNITFSSQHFQFNSTSKWISIHPGLHRVLFPEEMLWNLIDNIHLLTVEEKFFLLDNSFELAFDDYETFNVTFGIISKLCENEKSTLIWDLIERKLNRLDNLFLLSPDLIHHRFKNFVYSLIDPHLNQTNVYGALRNILFSIGLKYQHPEVISTLRSQFGNITSEFDRFLIYKNHVLNGDVKEFQEICEIYKNSRNLKEMEEAMISLTFTKNSNLIYEALLISLKFRNVKMLKSISKNPYSNLILWNYLRENIDELTLMFQGEEISQIVLNLSEFFSTNVKYEEFNSIQKEIQQPYQQMILDNISRNQRFLIQILPKIVEIKKF
jgi:aminopeptidase N